MCAGGVQTPEGELIKGAGAVTPRAHALKQSPRRKAPGRRASAFAAGKGAARCLVVRIRHASHVVEVELELHSLVAVDQNVRLLEEEALDRRERR